MSGLDITMLANVDGLFCSALLIGAVSWVAGIMGLWISFRQGEKSDAIWPAIIAMGPAVLVELVYLSLNKPWQDWTGNISAAVSRGWGERAWLGLIAGIPFLLGVITLIRVYYLHRKAKKQPQES